MKRTITLVAVLCLLQTLAFGQKKYEMVIEKTDGTETVINVEDIVRTYFRERTDDSPCPDENHPHIIDLGLPSGTKWACCNVGANAPEGYGDYFAWGETKPKDVYTMETYAYWRGDTNGDGWVDNNELVDLGSDIAGKKDYDAATANWGSPWKMPTKEQFVELIGNCTSEWTQENGIYGRKFTGSNGNTIFLPAAGGRWDGEFDYVGAYGFFWSSTLYESDPGGAYYLIFNSGKASWTYVERSLGRPVRPVCFGLSDLELSASTLSMTVGETRTVEITSGSGECGVTNLNSSIANATLDGTTITINALAEGNAKIEVTDKQTDQTITIEVTVTASGETEGHAPAGVVAVDLGLPSGTLWANMNVGASAPEDYGDYFAWGETKPKDVYTWETYAYWRDTNGDGSVHKNELVDLGSDIAGKKYYDAATANWGSPWKMPTKEQFEELIGNCTSEWTQENGIYGRKFTGSNGNTIFLPAAGGRSRGESDSVGSSGYYWSSTLNESYPYSAYFLYFDSGNACWGSGYRFYGRSVRPVR